MLKAGGITQCVQVLLGLCSLKIQDLNYFQNFTLFIQNSLLLNQYVAGGIKRFNNEENFISLSSKASSFS
jgi:hypothetical protein